MNDSLLFWLVLAISLVSYFFVSFGEASLASMRRERVQWLVAQGAQGATDLEALGSMPWGSTGALALFRFLLASSSLLSCIAFVMGHWVWVALVTLTVLVILGGLQIVSRALVPMLAERTALRIAYLVRILCIVVKPLVAIESWVVRRIAHTKIGMSGYSQETVSGEISIPVDVDGEPLDEREVKMIRGVVRLDTTMAREIMVPRGDMVAAKRGISVERLADLMVESGHSRVPVHDGSLDQILGIAHARDILDHLNRNEVSSVVLTDDLIRPALFIPESKMLEELLNEFQERRVHIAIVIDEYGGVSGLVTIEDLLEEIVGEIMDEFDVGDEEIEIIGDDEFMVDARVSIDQINELLHVDVEGNGFDTLGGFVYQRLGKMPSPGNVVEYDGLKIEVVSTMGRRLKKLRVIRAARTVSDE